MGAAPNLPDALAPRPSFSLPTLLPSPLVTNNWSLPHTKTLLKYPHTTRKEIPLTPPTLLLGPLVGGLHHTGANLWARAGGPSTLHAWLGRQPNLSDARPAGKPQPLTGQTGFAGQVTVRGLEPNTQYFYTLTLGGTPPPPAAYPSFTTFPPPGQPVDFNFAFGSCYAPREADTGEAFRVLDARRQALGLRFWLMIGDQVYADDWHHNGLGKVAVSRDEYRRVYAHTWSQPPLRTLLAGLPVFMTLDDHEVDDDWCWRTSTRRWAMIPPWNHLSRWLKGREPEERHLPLHRVRDALQVYWEHQGMHAPAPLRLLQKNYAGQFEMKAGDPGSLAYAFEFGAAAFFVMDTRTRRIKNREVLGAGQFQALADWLERVRGYPLKFLVTSSALLFDMLVDIARDRWSGYPRERERLLGLLAEKHTGALYLLAGDLHSGHAKSAWLRTTRGELVPLWEFCATPFEQKTNWLAPLTQVPILSRWLARQKTHFIKANYNFGLVQVRFDDPQTPRVRFHLVYKDKRSGEWLDSPEAG